VAQPGRRSDVDVERLQITLAKRDVIELLDRIVKIGKFGRNRNEVAGRIITDWLHDESLAELEKYAKRGQAAKAFDATFPLAEEQAK
jgi:hypothetical protein